MLNIEEIEKRLAKEYARPTIDLDHSPVHGAMDDIATLLSELKSLREENARLREATDALCAYYAERARAGDKEPMQVTNFRKAAS